MHENNPILLSNCRVIGSDNIKEIRGGIGDCVWPICALNQQAGRATQFVREGAPEAVTLQIDHGPDGHLRKAKRE